MRTFGRWVMAEGVRSGACEHGALVDSLLPESDPEGSHSRDGTPLFLPAPVDLHVHGAGGADVMGGEAALRQVLAVQASLGCGALLATSVCAPFEAIDAFLADVGAVMAAPDEGSATLLGAHLEGPFVNPDKLGAQPPHAVPVDVAALERWLASGLVRIVTFAPEMDANDALPTSCARHGVRAQIGHTLCGWARAAAAFKAGCGVTHLWNAMSGATHRHGGSAVAALARAEYAEIIVDGMHVERAAFEAARRAIPRLYAVTDGTAAVGMPDGTYRLGELEVQRVGDRVTLPDGTLAGSCLDQVSALSVLRGWDVDWPTIAQLTARTPAHWIEANEIGRIGKGARAHWLELDDERPVALWLDGVRRTLNETEPSRGAPPESAVDVSGNRFVNSMAESAPLAAARTDNGLASVRRRAPGPHRDRRTPTIPDSSASARSAGARRSSMESAGDAGVPTLLERLRDGLVVSCQPVPDGPMDRVEVVVALALAAEAGGACGLRVASPDYVRAVRAVTALPLIGLVKRDVDGRERITPETRDVAALVEAGADFVAFDATRRPRPASVPELVAAIHAHGRLAMADCSDAQDGREALAAGADVLGSTLSGYLDSVSSGRLEDVVPGGPDLAVVRELRMLTPYVVAEGRYSTPAQAGEAISNGAWSVVVGSAITRVEHVTSWFTAAVQGVARDSTPSGSTDP